jgi:hypothetical protein
MDCFTRDTSHGKTRPTQLKGENVMRKNLAAAFAAFLLCLAFAATTPAGEMANPSVTPPEEPAPSDPGSSPSSAQAADDDTPSEADAVVSAALAVLASLL